MQNYVETVKVMINSLPADSKKYFEGRLSKTKNPDEHRDLYLEVKRYMGLQNYMTKRPNNLETY